MPRWLEAFVHAVDSMNYFIGRIAMYLFFGMGIVLIWSILAKAFTRPPLWSMEMTEFLFVGYYLLGGSYALLLGANVRMDLLYSKWSLRKRAAVDLVTGTFMAFFLGVVLYGGIEATAYALDIGQRSSSAWRPYLAPVKMVICVGAFQMLMQSLAFLVRDIATLRGHPIPREIATLRLAIRPQLRLERGSVLLAED
ncbi:MAG: TRAP transporter small permease subunit [Rubellimicrobium sp.]|nr:TRAP transporter small permease subunit [Rubellimicrobium sp.]